MSSSTSSSERPGAAARRVWTTAACALALLGGLTAGLLALRGDALLEAGRKVLVHRHRFDNMLAKPRDSDLPLVLFLGDSTFGARYPRAVATQLSGRAETRVYWAAGTGPYQHYAVATRALPALRPEVVVLLAHLRVMLTDAALARPELLPELALPELPRALALPFHAKGLGAGRIALLSLAGTLLPVEAFDLAAGARELSRSWLPWLVPATWPRHPEERFRGMGFQGFIDYARPLRDDHPALEMLEASVALARRHGARVLVVVSPIPVARMRRAGLYDEAAFERRIGRLREHVEARGGELLDLHDVLAPSLFKDPVGHYDQRGANIIAVHVVRWVGETLGVFEPRTAIEPRGRTDR